MRRVLAGVMLTWLALLPASFSSAQSAPLDVQGLPLRYTLPNGKPSHYTAVLLTGDGGFASLDLRLADGLADAGVGVVLFNSREWLSSAKTPEQSAAAVVRAIRAGMAKFKADSIVIVGYSRGADIAPFVGSRLPADLREVLGGIAMFGLAPAASFEFHLLDMVKDSQRDSDIPILPELQKLQGVPMVCVYGSEEKSSGCRGVPESLMRAEMRQGGHHFDGDVNWLVNVVLKLVKLTK